MQKEEKIKRIVEYKRQGKTNKEIGLMEDIKTDEHTVGDYLKKAIEQGQITRDEIEEAMNQEKKILVRRIIEYAKQGLTRREIYRMPDMPKSESTITEYIELGIKLGMASRKQIEEARAKRAEQKEIEMLQQIMDYKARNIKNIEITNIPGMPNSENTITKYVRRAKKLGIEGREKHPQKLSELTTREKIEKHNTLMQQISTEIKENSENPLLKVQIRDYIDLCNEIYQEKEISIPELKFLHNIMHRIPIDVKDIVWYVQKAEQIEAYKEALEIISERNQFKIKILKREEKKFKEMEKSLINKTNILKIKLSKKSTSLLNLSDIEKILEYKRQGKSTREIIEMQDIDISLAQINYIVLKAEEYGLITKEEISKGKLRKNKEKKKEQVQQDPDTPLIIKYFKENKTFKEIASMPDIHGKNEQKISEYIGLLKEIGLITKKDMQAIEAIKENKKSQREKQIKEKVEKANDDLIREKIEKLLKEKELSTIMEEIKSITGKVNENEIRTISLLRNKQFQRIIAYAEQGIMTKDIVIYQI